GTVKLRAVFDNHDEMLFPNQFVNIKVLVSVEKNAIVVPSAALQHGRNGDFVYVMQREVVAEAPGDAKTPANPSGTPAEAPGKPSNEATKDSTPTGGAEAGKDHADGRQKEGGTNGSGPRGPGKVHLVKLTNVTVGHSDGEVTSILSGLKPGDIVVTDGADKLKDGAKVKPSMTKRGDKSGKNKQGQNKEGQDKQGQGRADDNQAGEAAANDSGNGKRGHRRRNAEGDAPTGQGERQSEGPGSSQTAGNGDSNDAAASNPPAFKRRSRDAGQGQDQASEGGQGEPGMRRHGGHRERSPE
ncbi:MAG: hypothetical protein ACAH10_00270, partial [Methylophilaceae bacterium]